MVTPEMKCQSQPRPECRSTVEDRSALRPSVQASLPYRSASIRAISSHAAAIQGKRLQRDPEEFGEPPRANPAAHSKDTGRPRASESEVMRMPPSAASDRATALRSVLVLLEGHGAVLEECRARPLLGAADDLQAADLDLVPGRESETRHRPADVGGRRGRRQPRVEPHELEAPDEAERYALVGFPERVRERRRCPTKPGNRSAPGDAGRAFPRSSAGRHRSRSHGRSRGRPPVRRSGNSPGRPWASPSDRTGERSRLPFGPR